MNRSDFSYTIEEHGPYNDYTCRIFYKGVFVSAFGTHSDGCEQKRKSGQSGIKENAEITIRAIMAGLSPKSNAIIARVDMEMCGVTK